MSAVVFIAFAVPGMAGLVWSINQPWTARNQLVEDLSQEQSE